MDSQLFVIQHIKMDRLGQKFKMNFLLFPDGCSFSLILVVPNIFKLAIAFSRYGNITYDIITDMLKN